MVLLFRLNLNVALVKPKVLSHGMLCSHSRASLQVQSLQESAFALPESRGTWALIQPLQRGFACD